MAWNLRRGALILTVAILAGCGGGKDAGGPAPEVVRAAASGTNLVIVLLDAASAHHLGCYGYGRNTTPHLDSVASESVVFERAYAQASGTMLSVFSFFTSRYPVFGKNARFKPWAQVKTIPPELPTFAERLAPVFAHRLGYTSNVWMKRHLGHARGFTEYWELWDPPEGLDGALTDDAGAVAQATAWMTDRTDGQFLAYLHLMKPHAPYDPPEPFFSLFATREIDPRVGTHEYIQSMQGRRPDAEIVQDMVALYDANLAHADHLVGEMIAELKAAGVWERTVFVLMADHGQGLYEHGKPHGHGGTICEATIRVPFFVRIPGVSGLAGRRIATPVELVDLVPTLLDLYGIATAADSLAGRSLLPLVGGEAASDGDRRLIHSRTNRSAPPTHSLSRGGIKLTATPVGRKQQQMRYALYDLAADPAESVNLLQDQPDHVEGQALKQIMKTWLKSGGAEGTAAGAVEFDVFDAQEVERLKSLGYVK